MKRILPTVVLMIGLVAVGRAADTHFIKPKSLDVIALLPPPPVAGSQEADTELAVVLKVQATRTEADVARAKAEAKLSPATFQQVLGEEFTAESFPTVYYLLEDAAKDSKVFSTKAKDYFARPRPNLADAHVQPLIEGETDPGYPSGHATRGMLWACILCEIAPDKKDVLLKRGQEIGWDRVVAGVHYPSDVYSARVLGQALVQAMSKNAEFQLQLAKAKQEFDAFNKIQSAPRTRVPVAAP